MSIRKESSELAGKLTRQQVHTLLSNLRNAIAREECRNCDCLQGFLTQLELDANDDITDLMAQFKVKPADMHGCLGCDPCPPGEIFSQYIRSQAGKSSSAGARVNLTISRNVYEQMVAAARKAIPLESCGLLAGKESRVSRCYELANADASPEHFSMKPEEQFAAVKDMRRMGLKMLAIWHSHPSTPPRMSMEDLRLAFTPDVVYVILSLAQDATPGCCAFVINGGIPQSIEVVITNE